MMKGVFFLQVIVLLTVMPWQPAVAMGVFSSRIIQGTILDASTQAPLEGVIVTASWMVLPLESTFPLGTLQALETVTDEQGQYTLPGWGPKLTVRGRLQDDQPMIRFFKPGYVPLIIANTSVYHPGLEDDLEHMLKEPVQRSGGRIAYRFYEPEDHKVKFGKKRHTFVLEPFEGTDDEYVCLLTRSLSYAHSLRFIAAGRTCEWKLLPITFATLHTLKAQLDASNINTSGILHVNDFARQNDCGSAEEYFKEYLE